jgi:beta-glucosidase
MANADTVHDGVVDDEERIEFLRQYLAEYGRAIEDGVPCTGFFQWSLLDNFEWAEGYSKRFGIIHVDYETQQRTLKDSAYWYSHVIGANEIPEDRPRILHKATG